MRSSCNYQLHELRQSSTMLPIYCALQSRCLRTSVLDDRRSTSRLLPTTFPFQTIARMRQHAKSFVWYALAANVTRRNLLRCKRSERRSISRAGVKRGVESCARLFVIKRISIKLPAMKMHLHKTFFTSRFRWVTPSSRFWERRPNLFSFRELSNFRITSEITGNFSLETVLILLITSLLVSERSLNLYFIVFLSRVVKLAEKSLKFFFETKPKTISWFRRSFLNFYYLISPLFLYFVIYPFSLSKIVKICLKSLKTFFLKIQIDISFKDRCLLFQLAVWILS